MFRRISIFCATFIVLPVITASKALAQDVHFSQFYLSPLTLNPAETGNFSGDWRYSTNYRTQWRAIEVPFNTFSLGYERNVVNRAQKVSLGLLVLRDQSGTAKIASNRAQISAAIHPKLNENNFHFGIQAGLTFKSFDISALSFPDQFDNGNGTFNTNLPNNEINYNQRTKYFDMNAGAAWSRVFNRIKVNTGIAVFHLNRPNESFFGSSERVPIRKVFSLRINWQLSDRIELAPKFFAMGQRAAAEYLFGTNCFYVLNGNKLKAQSIYAGAQTRWGINRTTDAVIGVVGMTFERMEVGLSYDVNVSGLKKATNMQGAVEFAVIFWSGSKDLKPKTISCDRF